MKIIKSCALASILSLNLAACAQTPAVAPAENDGAVLTEDVGGLPGSPVYAPLDVLRVAQEAGGVTKLDPTIAIAIIDAYRSALGQRVGSEALISDLDLVRAQLSSGSPDASIVGDALIRLGERTQAADAEDRGFSVLGKALLAAGKELRATGPAPARN